MNIISLKNVNLKYGDKQLFDNFNLDIKYGDFITIIGENGSGKSSLVKIILGLIDIDGEVVIDDIKMNSENKKDIISRIGFVFENPDNQFLTSTVREELAFPLENLNTKKEVIEDKISKISSFMKIDDLLDREPHTLSGGEKQLVSLATALITEPKILIIDEALSMVDSYDRDRIYKILKKINENNKMTIINVTHDVDEVLYGKKIVLLSKGNIIDYASTKKILSDEKKFNDLKLDIPFIVDLSNKLKYYELVDEMYLNMKDLVNDLWK